MPTLFWLYSLLTLSTLATTLSLLHSPRCQLSLTPHFFPTDDENTWKVEFRFDFHGPHLYTGTAKGNLEEGELSGEVESDQRKRTFVFTGSIEDGQFSGTHTETTKGREKDTGTMKLK